METIKYDSGYVTKPSPRRLTTLMELFTAAVAGKREVSGIENLHKVPAGSNLIVATGHITDLEIPLITATLGRYLDLAITDLSLHRGISKDPTFIGLLLAGRENFLPVQYKVVRGKRIGVFNPVDYELMVEASNRGKAILIATHNPSFDGIMPKNAGVGAVHLANELENSVVLPAVANIECNNLGQASNPFKTFLARPEVTVSLGEPLVLPKYEEGDRVSRNVNKAALMNAIARLYPQEKRGIWG